MIVRRVKPVCYLVRQTASDAAYLLVGHPLIGGRYLLTELQSAVGSAGALRIPKGAFRGGVACGFGR